MAINITNQWDPDFLNSSPIFSDLNRVLKNTHWTSWPGCQGLLALLDEPVILANGIQLDMQAQDESLPFPEMGYEERVYKKGIISTREQNWHDLFNAIIWMFFPKTKVLLNTMHMQELEKQPDKKRTPARDAITHLDESGIIVASSNTNLLDALKNHQWHELFVQSRSLWWQDIGAFVFGHGMYEKAFNPFIGFTGKAYCLEIQDNFFQYDKRKQYRILDQLLCADIKERNTLIDSRHLSPIPILGVPGWSKDNEDPQYYDNRAYFRSKRFQSKKDREKSSFQWPTRNKV